MSSFFTYFLVMISGDCEIEPNRDDIFQTSGCTGSVVAKHSVWTEIQCLDNCLRHPRCDKYIFSGKGKQNCQLLSTVDITGVVNLPTKTGACAPRDTTVSVLQKQAKLYPR